MILKIHGEKYSPGLRTGRTPHAAEGGPCTKPAGLGNPEAAPRFPVQDAATWAGPVSTFRSEMQFPFLF